MPVQTRAQRKAAETANDNPLKKSKSKSKPSKSTKRRLTDKAKKIGSPPNKKNKSKKYSPSQQLAKSVRKLQLTNDSDNEYKDSEEEYYSDIENKNEELEIKINNNREEIMLLQDRLLTQDTNYKLIGRSIEYNKILSFITNQLLLNSGNSFYICGSPGTGKSATIENIINYCQNKKNNFRKKYKLENTIKINAMALNNVNDIYSIIYNKIAKNDIKIKSENAKIKLEKYFINSNRNKSKIYIVIIDEMDGLLENSFKQSILYNLFGWSKCKHSKLILFGIANSIDLTDRFLPRLKQRNFEPELLIFEPYTKNQLIDIVKNRLDKFGEKYFDDIAIKLSAQKVAKMYGDVRKLLEIIRKSLGVLLVNEENGNINKKIGFMEMRQVLSSSFESPIIDIIRDLPNQQKTILIMGTILISKNNNKKVFIYDKLQQFYQWMAKKYILPKISSREFNIIIDSLISDNIIKIIKNNGRNNNCNINRKQEVLRNDTKLELKCKRNDIQYAVRDDELLNKFFEMHVVIPNKFRDRD